jgi:glycosyltransferase involved in cell wall biosynthesis
MRIGIVARGSPPGSHVVDRWRFDVLIRRLNSRHVDVQYFRRHVPYDLVIAPLRSDREELIKSIAGSGRCRIIGDVTDDVLAVALKRMLAPHRLSMPGRVYMNVRAFFAPRVPRMAELSAACDAVVVGSAAQAESMSRYHRATHVITDAILENPFGAVAKPRDQGPLKLAWIGNVESLDGLVSIQEVLDAIPGMGDLELHLVTGTQTKARILGKRPRNVWQFMEGQRVRCVFTRWDIDTHAREVARADIGIVPVATGSAFTLNKPAGRALLLMAAGLPVIATPIRAHREVIVPGETGFLPETPDDWRAALRALVASAHLRQTMGRSARDFALTSYGEESFAERYWRVIESVMGIT